MYSVRELEFRNLFAFKEKEEEEEEVSGIDNKNAANPLAEIRSSFSVSIHAEKVTVYI